MDKFVYKTNTPLVQQLNEGASATKVRKDDEEQT